MAIPQARIDTLNHELDIVVEVEGSWHFNDAELMDSCIEHGRFTRDGVDQITAERDRLGRVLSLSAI